MVLLSLCLISALAAAPSASAAFNCSVQTTCSSLVDYIPPNQTTYSAIKTLFGVKKLYNLFGANNLSTDTPQNVPAKQKIRVPITCLCANGTGVSNRVPVYTVKPQDSLDHIAREIFSELTTYQEIARVNGILSPYIIQPGQHLWVPIPCSCDEVGGSRVVHYGHVVDPGSSIKSIAQKYNTTEETLLKLNGMNDSSLLLAGQILDVPLQGF